MMQTRKQEQTALVPFSGLLLLLNALFTQFLHTLDRGRFMTCGRDQGRGQTQTKGWHIIIDCLILPGLNLIGFVPDSYIPITTDAFIEGNPGREVLGIAVSDVGHEVVS